MSVSASTSVGQQPTESTLCDLKRYALCCSCRVRITLAESALKIAHPDTDSTYFFHLDIRDALFVEAHTRRKIKISYISGASSGSFATISPKVAHLILSFSNPEEATHWRLLLLSIARPELASNGRGSPVLPPLVVFINPLGGRMRGRIVWKLKVRPLLDRAGRTYREIVTDRRGQITETCSELDPTTCSGILVVGGDGSAAEAVNGLMMRKRRLHGTNEIPLGVVPCGSSNALAKALGILSPAVAAFHVIKNSLRLIDGMELTGLEDASGTELSTSLVALCAVSLGFLSDVNDLSQGRLWRQLFGPARYGFCGARRVLCGGSIANYEAEVIVKTFTDELTTLTGTGSWDVLSPELWSGNGKLKLAGPGLVLAAHVKSFSVLRFLNKFSTSDFSAALEHVSVGIREVAITPQGRSASLPFSIDGELRKFRNLRVGWVEGIVRVFSQRVSFK